MTVAGTCVIGDHLWFVGPGGPYCGKCDPKVGVLRPCDTCGGTGLVPNGMPSNGPEACPDCGPGSEA